MTIAERLAVVRARIARAAAAAGRDPSSITLVAVSKRHPPAAIREAMAAGQRVFGENYAQELAVKAVQVPEAEWHFIGHLQRNKVRTVIPTGATIETVDRARLAREISKHAEGDVDVLIQVNVAREPSKAGCAVEELDALAAQVHELPHLRLRGLMTIPPAHGDPRPHFAALRALAEARGLAELSMGMSADLEAAIEEGATIVRVGTAIFGPRPA